MPIYEYHCKKCDTTFDVEQKMSDDSLLEHDGCGGELEKVFSSAGIVFKGSGFHKTDARKSSNTKSNSTKNQTPTTSPTDSDTKKKETDTSAKKPNTE